MSHYTLHFDGSCWKNPGGTAAYGYIIAEDGQGVIRSEHAVIGTGPEMSNNVAEFEGAYQALRDYALLPSRPGDVLRVLGDSNLVAQIMRGNWRAKDDKLYYPYYCKLNGVVRALREKEVSISFVWIPREENTICDDLSKAHNK
jgi:ribonuclease HI